MDRARRAFVVGCLLEGFLALCGPLVLRASPSRAITLSVDASEAPRKIFHARLVVPAAPGPLTLLYPKWIPGEHSPSGPITDLAGLKLTAGGTVVPWHRDLLDMFTFHCDVPQGASAVEIALDFLSPAAVDGFSAGASATAQVAVINWNQVVLYPQGTPTDDLTYEASLRLPAGWKFGTALPVADASGDNVRFKPVPLTSLVDSPVIAGAQFRVVPLAPGVEPRHEIDMAADSAAALDMGAEQIAAFSRLVEEAGLLFGTRHYRDYHFLYTLSDHTAHFGLEHHESSDDRGAERASVDPDERRRWAHLLPHEFVHSWNGKHRRPADLATPDYQTPMKTDLLWVYEGLTDYLGYLLMARSGLATPDLFRQELAVLAATLDHRPGRLWRPLEDTAVAAQILYNAPRGWESLRRGTDFYRESAFIWLEADVMIRQQTKGKRSLDDFCRRFLGGPGGRPTLETYTADDVFAALNEVSPYDWRGFFTARLESTGARAPLGGLEGSGWRLSYTETRSDYVKSAEESFKLLDLTSSIGITLNTKDDSIRDVIPGMAAADAGVGPGMILIAVNGRKYTPEVLRDALRATRSAAAPLDLLVENTDYFKTYRLDYHGGDRYPILERDPSRPDLLETIIRPLAPRPGGARAGATP